MWTVGTSRRSAISAIERNSAGVVIPPQMRGITEYVPSFLNAGVHPFVDETRTAVIPVFGWICGQQVVIQRGTTDVASIGSFPFQQAHQVGNVLQLLADRITNFFGSTRCMRKPVSCLAWPNKRRLRY